MYLISSQQYFMFSGKNLWESEFYQFSAASAALDYSGLLWQTPFLQKYVPGRELRKLSASFETNL